MRPENSWPWTVFSFDYPPNDGGIARLCSEIVKRLALTNSVRVITQGKEGGFTNTASPNLEEVRHRRRRPFRDIGAWWMLLTDRGNKPLIAGIWYPEGLIALLAGKRNLTILAHGAELTPPPQAWRRGIWAWLRRSTLERARYVVANSEYTARYVAKVAPRAEVIAIPLAVDHNRFCPGDKVATRKRFGIAAPDVRVVLTVSRIQNFKGIDLVLRAIALIRPEDRDRLVYLVAGKGPALVELQQLASDLGVASQVHWLGFVPEDDLPDLYRAADLFVLCTREKPDQRSVEGFGLVFLEAQASGTPVVGTRTGGIPDAISHGEGGWLIEQDDIEALRSILLELIRESSAFEVAGRAARMRVEREATWVHYMQRFLELWEQP